MANKYLTGFCSNGQHEGTKPRGWNGTPLKVCHLWQQCSCDCHEQITKMFEMTGRERVPMDNPEYIVPKRTFWMPSDDPDYLAPAAPDITDQGIVVMDKPVAVTETGRTQRGGLEFWVQRECLAWMLDNDGELCSVKYLSNEIARVEGISPPSQGAIAAVFDRWVKYNYAEISTDRPRRFLKLTEQGEKMGLDWCRANFKKSKKKAVA